MQQMDHSNFSFRLILFISLTFYALNPLCAQVELVAKPNNGKQRKGVSSPWFYEFKDQVYFKGADNISPGLFYTDGTEDGTKCLSRDFHPVTITSCGEYLYVMGSKAQYNQIFFNPFCQYAIWKIKYDHSEIEKVIDIYRGYGAWGFSMWTEGNRIFFSKRNGLSYIDHDSGDVTHIFSGMGEEGDGIDDILIGQRAGNEKGMFFIGSHKLLKQNFFYTDYTEEGTVPLGNIPLKYGPAYPLNALALLDNVCYNLSIDDTVQLWKSTGEPDSMELVWESYSADFSLYPAYDPKLTKWNNDLLFTLREKINDTVWHRLYVHTDGQVRMLNDCKESTDFIINATDTGVAILMRNDKKTDRADLWWYNDEGLNFIEQLVLPDKDFNFHKAHYFPDHYVLIGDRIGIYNRNNFELELLTGLIHSNIWNTSKGIFLFGKENYDIVDPMILQLDPIRLDTLKRMVSNTSYGNIRGLTPIGEELYFSADSKEFGKEPWFTDGSYLGSQLLIDIDSAGSSDPGAFVRYNNQIVFTVPGLRYYSHSLPGSVAGLWITDGTEEGTKMLADMQIEDEYKPNRIPVIDGSVYFVGRTKGQINDGWRLHQYREDQGVKVLFDGQNSELDLQRLSKLQACGGKLFFLAYNEESGTDLWTSDGSEQGTYSIDKIAFDGKYNTYFGVPVKVSGESLFYTQDMSKDGWYTDRNVHVTDGTAEGSFCLLSDGDSYGKSLHIDFIGGENGELFFTYTTATHGQELWYTGGLPENTRQLTGFMDVHREADKKFSAGKYLKDKFFFVCYTQEFGTELWFTDKTSEGTELFFELNNGYKSTLPKCLLQHNEHLLFFVEGEGITDPLWITDGSYEGTHPLPWNYPRLVNFKEALIWKDDLYFIASHPDFGQGIFKYHLDGVTGIEERGSDRREAEFELFPNPAGENIYLRMSPEKKSGYKVEILDNQGRKVKEMRKMGEECRISVQDLPSGIYFIRIGDVCRKFVKE
jgi:ELWxxDGT repeat protein